MIRSLQITKPHRRDAFRTLEKIHGISIFSFMKIENNVLFCYNLYWLFIFFRCFYAICLADSGMNKPKVAVSMARSSHRL